MRMLMTVEIPTAKGSTAVQDGTLERTIERIMGMIKPEAAYFVALNGKRTALFFFDMADPAQIPAIAEPIFAALDAEINFVPAMTGEDVVKGLAAAGQAHE